MLSRFTQLALLIVSALLSFSALSAAGPEKTSGFRAYDLVQHGTLQLSVPNNWNDQLRRQQRSMPSIILTPEHGHSFSVLITPLYEATPPDSAEIKNRVTNAAEAMQAQVVETTILVQEMQGTSGAGYYFSVTDRAPKPDEFKYLTQGALRTGGLVLNFVIFSNDGAEAAVANALTVIREARLAATKTR